MNTQTTKILAAVGLIVATGVAAVELTRAEAKSDPLLVAGGVAGYAGSRVDSAFEVAHEQAAEPALPFAVVAKGDRLPAGCAGPMLATSQAECLDTAYEVASEPSIVVETRLGTTSVLMRMDGFTVAGF